MFLNTVDPSAAEGDVARIYSDEIERLGFVMEATRVWTTRPEMLEIWAQFQGRVKSVLSLSERDWKLITLVAAKRVPSTYCSLVYGRSLASDLDSPQQVIEIENDFRNAGLNKRDVGMLEYADQITIDASKVSESHIQNLRDAGFTDGEIYDIAYCASIRNFISRFFDSLGATPDADLLEIEEPLRQSLVVGRPLRT